jgi:hypothetical protein
MNMAALAKHYDKLTPEERCGLSLAAWSRGDELEYGRLVRAAPSLSFTFGGDWPQAVAFHYICWMHLLAVLDLAARLYQRLGWAASTGEREDTYLISVCVQFRAQLDGWRQFCAEIGIDPDAFWHELPGFAMVRLADMATAAANAETRLPLEMVTLQVEGSDEPLTADFIARKLRADWRAIAALWEGGLRNPGIHQL